MMSWENYGRNSGEFFWEVDHKIPWKHFDLTDIFQRKKYNFLKKSKKINFLPYAKVDWIVLR